MDESTNVLKKRDLNSETFQNQEETKADEQLTKEIPSVESINQLYKEYRIGMDELKGLLNNYLIQIDDTDHTWLRGKEVQKLLRISERTLKRYRDANLIRYCYLSKRCRYFSIDVNNMMKKD